MPHVLVVEDDPQVRGALLRSLDERGYATSSAPTGMAGLETAVTKRPDLVVLDLGLPDVDGTDILRMLRGVSNVPVIVATARDGEGAIISALNAGADDYLVKPFGAAQLEARIRAVLRRTAPADHEHLQIGELTIDPPSREVRFQDRPLELTPKEFDLLLYLAERVGKVVSRRELLTEVWHLPYGGGDKTVDVHLSWLRRKLGETGQRPVYLHSYRGVGIKLVSPDEFPDGRLDGPYAPGGPDAPGGTAGDGEPDGASASGEADEPGAAKPGGTDEFETGAAGSAGVPGMDDGTGGPGATGSAAAGSGGSP